MSGGRLAQAGADTQALARDVLAGQRSALGRAITLVESTSPAHRDRARALLRELLPHAGKSQRIGITGMPGAGKSTLIEALGQRLVDDGHRVAVLAVDPSSIRTGGSILGDKTRMPNLAKHARAFIRPSPSGGTLGGVARRTREALIVCEAAGYDIVFVETVGVGQSEAVVAEMVDFFMCLTLAGGGDGLQGIKRGVLEWADALVITKADGDNIAHAEQARQEYAQALSLVTPAHVSGPGLGGGHWQPRVLTCSALTGAGLDSLWETVAAHREQGEANGSRTSRRTEQDVRWMWRQVDEGLAAMFREHAAVRARLTSLEAEVRTRSCLPDEAADELLMLFASALANS